METPEIVTKKNNPPAPDGHGPIWCGGCEAYIGNKIGGACRGGIPTPIVVGLGQDLLGRQQPVLNSYWPTVGITDWCLSFKRAPSGRVLDDPPPIKKPDAIVFPDGGRA